MELVGMTREFIKRNAKLAVMLALCSSAGMLVTGCGKDEQEKKALGVNCIAGESALGFGGGSYISGKLKEHRNEYYDSLNPKVLNALNEEAYNTYRYYWDNGFEYPDDCFLTEVSLVYAAEEAKSELNKSMKNGDELTKEEVREVVKNDIRESEKMSNKLFFIENEGKYPTKDARIGELQIILAEQLTEKTGKKYETIDYLFADGVPYR